MKKRVLSIISVLMIMVMAFAGCSSDGDTKKLVGEWKATINLKDYMDEDVVSELNSETGSMDYNVDAADYINDVQITIDLTFNADNTFYMRFNQGEFDDSMSQFLEELKGYMKAYLTAVFAKEGVNVGDVLPMYGVDSLDQLIDQLCEEQGMEDMINVDMSEFSAEGQYRAKGGKFYASDSVDEKAPAYTEDTYVLKGDSLTLVSEEITLEFKRQ